MAIDRQPGALLISIAACVVSLMAWTADSCTRADAKVEDGQTRALALSFAAVFGDAPFSCTEGAVVDGVVIEPTDFRLFVHDVRVEDRDGTWVPVQLDEDGIWQSDGVALLDFENGADHCRNGTPETRTIIRGRVPEGDYVGLRFGIGVPFERNHVNPSRASAPLTLTAMHWSWQGGFKFLRFDALTPGGGYRVHLGSTACEGTIGHVERCNRENRPEVLLNALPGPGERIAIDLARLLSEVSLGESTAESSGALCMSGADDPDCAPIYRRLGLDPASGQAIRSADVFEVR